MLMMRRFLLITFVLFAASCATEEQKTRYYCSPNKQTYDTGSECVAKCKVSLAHFSGICMPQKFPKSPWRNRDWRPLIPAAILCAALAALFVLSAAMPLLLPGILRSVLGSVIGRFAPNAGLWTTIELAVKGARMGRTGAMGATGSAGLGAEATVMGVVNDAALAARARSIHSLVSQATQNRTTIGATHAITENGISKVLISSSEHGLRRVQQQAVRLGEIAVRGVGHAESTGIGYAHSAGWTVQAVAASRAICQACANAIRAIGAGIASALRTGGK
jgi:hypothetical protein